MKKFIAFLLCLIIIVSIISCKNDNSDNSLDTTNDSNENTLKLPDDPSENTLSDSVQKYYDIKEINSTTVQFCIYDLEGNTIFSEETDKSIEISMFGKYIVDVCVDIGYGIKVNRYYDVQNIHSSDEYHNVIAISGNLVAYIDTVKNETIDDNKIVIRDIFDDTIFYKSFDIKCFPDANGLIGSAKFTPEEMELEVVYYVGKGLVSPENITLPIRRNDMDGEEFFEDMHTTEESKRAIEAYGKALENKIEVFEVSGTNINFAGPLKDIRTPYSRIPLNKIKNLRYAYLDVDGDSVNELIIDCGDILILRYYQENVYVYPFTFREMYYLKTDGSYSWNHNGEDFEYGESKINFDGIKLKTERIWRIVNDGEPNAEYYIGNRKVTQKEILKYFEDNHKTKLEFFALEIAWQNEISPQEAIEIAKKYWESLEIEKNKYIVCQVEGYNAPFSVYVIVIKWLVMDHHYSTIDEIWIDKYTGETIIPYDINSKG